MRFTQQLYHVLYKRDKEAKMKRPKDTIQDVLLNPQNYKRVSVSHLMSFDNQPACAFSTLTLNI